MNYTAYVNQMQTMLVIPTNNTDDNFTTILPRMIEYAELRIYREFDFLCTSASQLALLTISNRNVALPTNVIVCESANVITPASAVTADAGTRNPLQRASLDFINAVYPSGSGATVPKFYAEIGNPTITPTLITAGAINIILGPTPDAAYNLEVIGTVRPTALSSANPNTFLTNNMPDLFVAASMIYGTGYQRNFGASTSDPQMGMSWSQQYDALKAGINLEELRKKAQSTEWSSRQPSPIANVPRDRNAA